jgi:hypothetical protein
MLILREKFKNVINKLKILQIKRKYRRIKQIITKRKLR